MDEKDYVTREDFGSFGHLMTTLEKRQNNKFMENEHASQKKDKEWTGTESYDEAKRLLRLGYPDAVSKIQKKLHESQKIASELLALLPKDKVHNMPIGFIPHVPNAIQGLPDSMINIQKVNQKRKVLDIYYSNNGSCGRGTNWFIEAGVALVSAINIVETSGIQTKLHLCFATSQEDHQILLPSVVIKDFGERFSIQKVSFPLVHPSMFRRIGFKYMETCPEMKEDFSHGYGHAYDNEDTVRKAINNDKTFYISAREIHVKNCDIKSILQEMGVLKNGH